MAKRLCFVPTYNIPQTYKEIEIEFKYYSGFAVSQKQKSIKSLHESIMRYDKTLNILEVSSKSTNPLGVALSAFNLKVSDDQGKEFLIENIFQSSKVFELGGPYKDLLYTSAKHAKTDERLKTSGKLLQFDYNGTIWDLEPKTMFYDWIYINALRGNELLSKEILEYNAFTDIEFNHNKSVNCQARSAAIFVTLSAMGCLNDVLRSKEEFEKIYQQNFQSSFL